MWQHISTILALLWKFMGQVALNYRVAETKKTDLRKWTRTNSQKVSWPLYTHSCPPINKLKAEVKSKVCLFQLKKKEEWESKFSRDKFKTLENFWNDQWIIFCYVTLSGCLKAENQKHQRCSSTPKELVSENCSKPALPSELALRNSLFCFSVFGDRVSLCNRALLDSICRPDWPWNPRDRPASASPVLELKACTTTPRVLEGS